MADFKTFLLKIIGVVLEVGIGFLTIKIFMDLVSAKSKMLGSLRNGAKGLTQKARDRAERSNFYQRRKMADEAKIQEKRRANVEDYAARARGTGLRSTLLRRRAAGGIVGQVFNTNQAGQQRVYQAAEDVQRKQRHEEAERASKNLARSGFEGDADFMAIARTATGGSYTSARTGRTIQVTDAVRQAAVNNLVQQGRTSQIRELETYDEATGTSYDRVTNTGGIQRGAGGVATSDLHHLLDHAYEDYAGKLSDKAPDLMPSRRASEGLAAFTDLKPEDVSAWHHSTVTAASDWYGATTTGPGGTGAALTPAEIARRASARDQMLRSFSQATRNPSTRSKLSLDQVRQVRTMMNDAIAAGHPVDPTVQNDINNTFTALGG